jgi:hypothetical protein
MKITSSLSRVRQWREQYGATALISIPALLLFLSVGLNLLRKAGFQSDEVMFVYDLWHPRAAAAWSSLFGDTMPLMLMPYLGALKCWLYTPILHFVDVSQWSVRVPALLLSTATILITRLFIGRIAGKAAGLLVLWLLATDVTFLFTAVFDWGPVVLQNLLLVSGMFLVAEWRRAGRNWLLFLAGLVFGLALWDKALFIWNLSAMIIALGVVNGRTALRVCRLKQAGLAALGLSLGAYPLIYFNLTSERSTLSENVKLTPHDVAPKGKYLVEALDGMKAETEWCDPSFQPLESSRRMVLLSSWRFYSMLIALPLGMVLSTKSHRKWILFFILSACIAWLQAATTVNAGGSMHHVVLIWPFLYCALAMSFAALAQVKIRFVKPALLLIIAIVCVRGFEAMKATSENLSTCSHTIPWTDADASLSNMLMTAGVERVLAVDWGIANVVAVRTSDLVSVVDESFELSDGRFDKDRFLNCKAQGCAVVSHVKERSVFRPAQTYLDECLRSLNLAKSQLTVIRDSHGSPAFVLYRIKEESPTVPPKTLEN